jgi:hypothetical protein
VSIVKWRHQRRQHDRRARLRLGQRKARCIDPLHLASFRLPRSARPDSPPASPAVQVGAMPDPFVGWLAKEVLLQEALSRAIDLLHHRNWRRRLARRVQQQTATWIPGWRLRRWLGRQGTWDALVHPSPQHAEPPWRPRHDRAWPGLRPPATARRRCVGRPPSWPPQPPSSSSRRSSLPGSRGRRRPCRSRTPEVPAGQVTGDGWS